MPPRFYFFCFPRSSFSKTSTTISTVRYKNFYFQGGQAGASTGIARQTPQATPQTTPRTTPQNTPKMTSASPHMPVQAGDVAASAPPNSKPRGQLSTVGVAELIYRSSGPKTRQKDRILFRTKYSTTVFLLLLNYQYFFYFLGRRRSKTRRRKSKKAQTASHLPVTSLDDFLVSTSRIFCKN